MTTLQGWLRPKQGGGVLDAVTLHVVDSLAELDACRAWAGWRRPGPLCFDTESSCLSPWQGRLRLVQLGDTLHGWAFRPDWAGAALEILDRAPWLAAHNSVHDSLWLQVHCGWRPRWEVCEDTMLAWRLLDSAKLAGLKPLATRAVDDRAGQMELAMKADMKAGHWDHGTIPDTHWSWLAYSALDPVLTAHTWAAGASRLAPFRGPYDLEKATARICAGMMTAGMMVDVPFIEEKMTAIRGYRDRVVPELRDQWGVASVNSTDQVTGLLNGQLGLPVLAWTPGGAPSADKAALRTYANMFPEHRGLIEMILWARKADKICSAYLEKFLDMRTAGDIVHYTINTAKADTHRMSVTAPPMQTFDRDEPAVRGAFIPRPGSVIISVDADQIEARLAAHCSRDRNMIAEFRRCDEQGLSFFVEMASKIYRERITKKDPRYTMTKNATYSWFYGAGKKRMALTAGVSEDVIAPVYDGLNQLYPGVRVMSRRIIRQAERMAEPGVRTLGGRVLRCRKGREYSLVDYQIQGSAAEILKQGLVALDAAGYGPALCLPVHDEVLLEVPAEHAREALDGVTRVLTDRDSYAVPLTWGGSILEERWCKT